MEIAGGGWTHRAFPIDDASRVGEARRHAALLAESMHFDVTDAGRLALVVTELGTNLQRHARDGQLLLAARPGWGDVEVIAIDRGPGIGDPSRCMEDGFSTGGSPGEGLGAIRRLAQEFDLHSSVPEGTLCVARVRAGAMAAGSAGTGGAFAAGAICLPAPRESVSGDAFALAFAGTRASVLLADGLGHGPEACAAATEAVACFMQDPFAELAAAVQSLHRSLQGTRGAAVCVAALDPGGGRLRYAGAGNIGGRVLSGLSDRSLATQHGTAGVQVRSVQPAECEWPLHGVLVLHSDGLESRWDARRYAPLLGRDPALLAAALLRDHSRRRDDTTIVVLRPLEHR